MSNVYATSCKGIVKQLLNLASDSENQKFIVKEAGCIQGLVGYLKHEDESIVAMAAQAIQFLSVDVENRIELLKCKNLIPNLVTLTTCRNSKIRDFASASLSNLNALLDKENASSFNTSNRQQTSESEKSPVKAKPAFKKSIKTFILYVDELDDTFVHSSVERALICEKGVTSVTLNASRNQAVVFANPEMDILQLVTAVRGVGVAADTWANKLKNSKGSKASAPGYLDDVNLFPTKAAVTNIGFGQYDPLLLHQKRKAAAKKTSRAQRLIGKIGSGLSTATSWFW